MYVSDKRISSPSCHNGTMENLFLCHSDIIITSVVYELEDNMTATTSKHRKQHKHCSQPLVPHSFFIRHRTPGETGFGCLFCIDVISVMLRLFLWCSCWRMKQYMVLLASVLAYVWTLRVFWLCIYREITTFHQQQYTLISSYLKLRRKAKFTWKPFWNRDPRKLPALKFKSNLNGSWVVFLTVAFLSLQSVCLLVRNINSDNLETTFTQF